MLVPSVGVLRKAHPAVRELEHRRLLFSVSDLEREGETFFGLLPPIELRAISLRNRKIPRPSSVMMLRVFMGIAGLSTAKTIFWKRSGLVISLRF